MRALYVSLLLLHLSLITYSQAGNLDSTFGYNGSIIFSGGYGLGKGIHDVAVQSNGNIVAVGQVGASVLVARLDNNGSFDSSFAQDGILECRVDPSGFSDKGFCTTIQPDGRILIAGITDPIPDYLTADDVFVMRLNADGSIDSSFNGNGVSVITISTGDDFPTSMVMQPDGKIVVCGYYNDIFLLRLNPDGSLDSSFDEDGIVITDLDNYFEYAEGLCLLPDGKLLVAGYKFVGITNEDVNAILLRYNADGSLDDTWGDNGVLMTDVNSETAEEVTCVAIDGDSRIVVGGARHGVSVSALLMIRYNPTGIIDSTFGTNGIVETDFQAGVDDESIKELSIQPDNKIIALSQPYIELLNHFRIIRYKNDGVVDSTFGVNGIVNSNVCPISDAGSALAISDNKVVVGGLVTKMDTSLGFYTRCLVSRFLLGDITPESSDLISLSSYKIFPNPATTTIQIHLPYPTIISIFSLPGEKVKEQKVITQQVTMDVSELPAGMYVVRTEKEMMGKFVKEK